MTEHTDLSLFAHFDDLRYEYESMFSRGTPPRIQDFLKRVPSQHRSAMVRELVVLDVVLRRDRGDHLTVDELVDHFSGLLPPGEDSRAELRSTIENALAPQTTREFTDPEDEAGLTTDHPVPTQSRIPLVEGFEIEGVLGRGGMGVVYRATQTSLGRTVALKTIRPDTWTSDSELRRFKLEAEAIADLNDPQFVQVHQFVEGPDFPYMVLEFVAGGSLEEYCQSRPQSVRFAGQMVESLAKAMEKAHAKNLIHRDLKPQNVLLTSERSPKIADFGLVKRISHDTQITEKGHVVGTVSYMAPEQTHANSQVQPSTDVHALGGILYYLLTGRPPFLAATKEDTILQVRADEPVAPSSLRPGVPKDLETICLKCLQKDPVKRYVSAADLADDLHRFLENRPILARPVSSVERSWRWARRNPWIAGLGATVAVLLVTVTIGSTLMSWKLSTRTTEAEYNATRANFQRQQAERAREHEAGARREAQDLSDIALESLLTLARGGHDALAGLPHAEAEHLRKTFLDTALSGLKNVTRAGTTNLVIAGAAHFRVGQLLLRNGLFSDAEKEFEKSRSVAQQMTDLAEYQEKRWVPLFNVARAEDGLGDAHLGLSQRDEAKRHYETALKFRKDWLRLDQETSRAEQAIADSLARLGALHRREESELPVALDYYRQALELRRSLHEGRVDDPRVQTPARMQFEYGGSLMSIGGIHKRLGEHTEAAQHLEQARTHIQRALDAWRDEPGFQEEFEAEANIAIICADIGETRLLAKNHQAAIAPYKEAVERLRTLHASNANNRQIRQALWRSLYGLGTVYLAIEPAQAQPTFQESLVLASNPIQRLLSLARCHRRDEAAKLARQLKPQVEKQPTLLYYVACGYALCASSLQTTPSPQACSEENHESFDKFSDRSVDLLASAIAGGYNNLAELESNPELDAIRGHADFPKLVQLLSAHGANDTQP